MDRLAVHVLAELSRLGVVPGAAVLVACSGGPDSMVLAHIAATLAQGGHLGEVTLVHVDHGLRPHSEVDGHRVAHLAAATGVAFRQERVDVPREASLEAAARRARYDALERVADDESAAAVLVAHTANDQAETVLMRICRGTGVAGLAAMAPRRGRIVRPLLSVERPAIAAYLRRHRLEPVSDPMNADVRFSRVRWRTQWLPALEHENPRIVSALCRLADSAREPREVLDFAADALLASMTEGRSAKATEGRSVKATEGRSAKATEGRSAKATEGHSASMTEGLSVAQLAAAPRPVTARALAMAAEAAGGGPLTHRHVDALLALIHAPETGTRELDLPGLTAARVYDRLRFAPIGYGHGHGHEAWQVKTDPGLPTYRARLWQPGDRMRPARLRGRSRKLSDLYTDLKIPRADRRRAVVLEKLVPSDVDGLPEAEIAWAEHIGPAFDHPIVVTLTPPCVIVSNKG